MLILWGTLAIEEQNNPNKNNVEHVDMLSFFILGCIFIVLYRFVAAYLAWTEQHQIFDIFLGFVDLSIINEVYKAYKSKTTQVYVNSEIFIINFGKQH